MTTRLNGPPRVHQINVSHGGVPKLPVPEAKITVSGIEGDRQRHTNIHGGLDRAVCLYSLEAIEALQAEGHPIAPGSTGDNVTIAGLDWSSLKPGDRLRIGPVELELLSYTTPCIHNARWFVKGDFSRISHKKYPGWSRMYAGVSMEGSIRVGDAIIYEPGNVSR
jgi:MOSC domain-containing protein YiiM